MRNMAKINYLIDVMILMLFVLSAVSGFGLMRPNDARQTTTMEVNASRSIVSEVHILTSFLLVAGVGVHFMLHWRWMSAMSKALAQRRTPGDVAITITSRT